MGKPRKQLAHDAHAAVAAAEGIFWLITLPSASFYGHKAVPPHLQLMIDPCRHHLTWHRPVRLRFCRQQPRFERLARPRQNPNHEQQRALLTLVAHRLLTRHANTPCGNAAQKNRRGHRPQMCVRGSLCAFRALFAKIGGVRDSGSLGQAAPALSQRSRFGVAYSIALPRAFLCTSPLGVAHAIMKMKLLSHLHASVLLALRSKMA